MKPGTILVTGANSPAATELITLLRNKYGINNVIAADKAPRAQSTQDPYERLDPTQNIQLKKVLINHGITQVYHMDGLSSDPIDPVGSWNLQLKSLITLLEVARECSIAKIFWPAPTGDQLSVPRMVGIAGQLWCKWYNDKYGMQIRTLSYHPSSPSEIIRGSIHLMESTQEASHGHNGQQSLIETTYSTNR